MSSAPDLPTNPALPGKAGPARSAAATGPSAKEPAASFASLMSAFGKGFVAAVSSKAEAPSGSRLTAPGQPAFAAKAAQPPRVPTGLDAVGPSDAEAAEAAGSAADAMTIDATGHDKSLTERLADRIVIAVQGLEGDRAGAARAATGDRADAGLAGPAGHRGGAMVTGDGAGATIFRAAAGMPSKIAVLHQETHFAPVRTTGALGSAEEADASPPRRAADGASASALTRPDRGGTTAGVAGIRHMVTEQMMVGGGAGLPRPVPEPAFGSEVLAQFGAGLAASRAADPAAPLSGMPATAPAAPASPPAGAAGPVRVLHIQLEPADLGTLEVRMRLTDAGLELHIDASRPETAALLKNDREALASVLRTSGYAPEAVTVSVTEKGGQNQSAAHDGSQPPASGARADSQSGAPREQGGRPDPRFPSRPDDGRQTDQVQHDQDPPSVGARHRGDLYL